MYLEEKLVAVRTFLRFLFLVQKKENLFQAISVEASLTSQ